MIIQNPILRGFNPDPSIIRVGSDYYIATSTFEWFPGVQIHHSTDLVHWELLTRPLNRLSQLDLLGVPDSGGVWAPCLSYDNGTFYLVYSNVKSFDGIWKDTPNYLVTTNDILGDWSDPVFLNSSGFDGSLFHDDDGRKYYLSMVVDHRKGKMFGGIILQEYDQYEEKLIGPVYPIFSGTDLGCTEGPHIYKRNGYYYLITAEGGTEYGHAVTIARSQHLTGPYEIHPTNPLLTARDHSEAPLQKTGHADLVEAENGDWFIVFLCGRPLSPLGRCTLGRETAIEEVVWADDQWPYLKTENRLARTEIPSQKASLVEPEKSTELTGPTGLDIHFQSLRIPVSEDWLSTTAREGYVRLYGQASLSSLHRQSLFARRVQDFHFEANVTLDFQPDTFQQLAGLVCYYNSYHWHYCHIYGDNGGKRYLQIISCDKYEMTEKLDEPLLLITEEPIPLKVVWNRSNIQFSYSNEQDQWKKLGPVLDGSILSDDYVRDEANRYRPAFTGAFVGMCCQDLSGLRKHADFTNWTYISK